MAAGTRRIEALTGEGVLDALRRQTETLAALGEVLRSKPDTLLEAAEKLADSEKKLNAAAISPLIVAPNAMIGTTIALATIPTIANWLKWYAVRGAVPTIAQNDTAR